MIGLEQVGLHIPLHRLARSEIADLWGGRGRPGERAVAGWDEDALTMAAQAAEQALAGVDRQSVDLLILASTSFPYAEKQTAALAAEALDLQPGVQTVDVGNSLRGGTQALRLALDALAGGARRVLVACADARPARGGSRHEAEFGDGAVAFLLGPAARVALRPLATRPSAAMDQWRLPADRHVRQADERFSAKVVYQGEVGEAVAAALALAGLAAADIARVALPAADHRAAMAGAAACGFPATAVAGAALYEHAGHCGAATALLCLVAALEEAEADRPVLLVGYGDGVDVFLATPAAAAPFGTPLQSALRQGIPLRYAQFLRYKELLEGEPVDPYTSEMAMWRDHRPVVRRRAPRCNQCGAIQYPPRRICWRCQSKDNFSEVRLADTGKVYTFTVEHLFPVGDAQLVTAAVDLDDGARIYTQMADCPGEQAAIGMPVRLALRRLHSGSGIHHYFWKAVPAAALGGTSDGD